MIKKKVKDLKNGEIENICNSQDGCANCPFIISSYGKKIRCIRDDKFEIWEIEKVYNLLNTEIEVKKWVN